MHAWSAKFFKANIFVIHKALPKFTRILSHRNLEPYGIHTINSKLNWSEHIEKQVDILISKNQALQMLYLKHHVYKTS